MESLLADLIFEVRVLKIAVCFLASCNLIQLLIMAKNQRTLF